MKSETKSYKRKGKIPYVQFFLGSRMIVALSKFRASAVILRRKKQLTFLLKLVLQNMFSS